MTNRSSTAVANTVVAILLFAVLGAMRPTPASAAVDEAYAQKLMEKLKSTDDQQRYEAIRSLRLIQYKAALPAVKKAAFDDSDRVAMEAGHYLSDMGDNSLVPDFLKMLASTEEADWVRAANVLGMLGDPDAVPALLKVFNDKPRARGRSSVARALGQVGDQTAVGPLVKAMNEQSRIRSRGARLRADMAVIVALGGLGGRGFDVSQAVEPLIVTMKDAGRGILVRRAAASSLIRIGGDKANKAIAEAENGNDAALKQAVASARDIIGRIERLEESASKLAEGRARAAVEAKEKAKQDDAKFANALKELKDPDPAKRSAAVRLLGNSKNTGYAEQIKELLADPQPNVRADALFSYAHLLKEAAREVVVQYLTDEDKIVRWAAGNGLLHVGALEAKHAPALLGNISVSKGTSSSSTVSERLIALGADAVAPTLAYLKSEKFWEQYAGAVVAESLIDKAGIAAESFPGLGPVLLQLANSDQRAANSAAFRLLPKIDQGCYVTAVLARLDKPIESYDPPWKQLKDNLALLDERNRERLASGILAKFRRLPVLRRPSLMPLVGKLGDRRAAGAVIETVEKLSALQANPGNMDPRERSFLPGHIVVGIMTLGEIGSPEALPVIKKHLSKGDLTKAGSSGDLAIKAGCINALGKIGGPEAVAIIKEYLINGFKHLKATCISALGMAGDATSAGLLRPMLDDPSNGIRMAAAEALARMGDRQSLKRLLGMADGPDREAGALRMAFTGFFRGTKSAADERLRSRLNQRMARMDFKDINLTDVIQFCSEYRDVPIVANWNQLRALGVTETSKVSMTANNMSCTLVLLKSVAAQLAEPGKVAFRIVHGALYITSDAHSRSLPISDERAWQSLPAPLKKTLAMPVKIVAKGQPLRAVIEGIAHISGVTILLAEAPKLKAKLDPDAKVDLGLGKVPLRDALGLAWLQAGATTSLYQAITSGDLVITPPPSATPPKPPVPTPADPTTKTKPPTQPGGPASPAKEPVVDDSAAEKAATKLLSVADVFRESGLTSSAAKKYRAIIEKYPNTKAAEAAKGHLKAMGE